jgi:hypothetical protein
MGREKRASESKAKDILAKSQQSLESRAPAASASAASSGFAAPAVSSAVATTPARALINILLLFAVPTALLILLGKLMGL